jgi:hypothetical protein
MFMPRALAQLVDQVARNSVGKDWNLYAALLEHWAEIVGSDYARIATPVKIVFPHQPKNPRRERGILTIRLPRGLAMEFTFKGEQIRSRINAYFGHEAVGRIALDASYAAPPAPRTAGRESNPAVVAGILEEIKAIDDIELRDALEAFGKAIN